MQTAWQGALTGAVLWTIVRDLILLFLIISCLDDLEWLAATVLIFFLPDLAATAADLLDLEATAIVARDFFCLLQLLPTFAAFPALLHV